MPSSSTYSVDGSNIVGAVEDLQIHSSIFNRGKTTAGSTSNESKQGTGSDKSNASNKSKQGTGSDKSNAASKSGSDVVQKKGMAISAADNERLEKWIHVFDKPADPVTPDPKVMTYVHPHGRGTGRVSTVSDSAIAGNRALADNDWLASRSNSSEPAAKGSASNSSEPAAKGSDSNSSEPAAKGSASNATVNGGGSGADPKDTADPLINNGFPINYMHITSENAQSIYGPTSCVFVANLPWEQSDGANHRALYENFRQFANNSMFWIIVHRCPKGNPYAHIQYTTDAEADLAVREGHGMNILGRPCRTEISDRSRLYYVSQVSRQVIYEYDVRRFLEPMGEITRVWPPSAEEVEKFALAPGYFAEVKDYKKALGALSFLRTSNYFNIRPAQFSVRSGRRVYRRHIQDDSKSIFVGHLALGTSQDTIRDNFVRYGTIVSIHMCQKKSRFEGATDNCFCFVEYAEDQSKSLAIECVDGAILNGSKLRVYAKIICDRDSNGNRIQPLLFSSYGYDSHKRVTARPAENLQKNNNRYTPLTPPATVDPDLQFVSSELKARVAAMSVRRLAQFRRELAHDATTPVAPQSATPQATPNHGNGIEIPGLYPRDDPYAAAHQGIFGFPGANGGNTHGGGTYGPVAYHGTNPGHGGVNVASTAHAYSNDQANQNAWAQQNQNAWAQQNQQAWDKHQQDLAQWHAHCDQVRAAQAAHVQYYGQTQHPDAQYYNQSHGQHYNQAYGPSNTNYAENQHATNQHATFYAPPATEAFTTPNASPSNPPVKPNRSADGFDRYNPVTGFGHEVFDSPQTPENRVHVGPGSPHTPENRVHVGPGSPHTPENRVQVGPGSRERTSRTA